MTRSSLALATRFAVAAALLAAGLSGCALFRTSVAQDDAEPGGAAGARQHPLQDESRPDATLRYFGKVHYRYADGRRAESEALVERHVSPANGRITETIWRAPAQPRQPGTRSVVELERVGSDDPAAVAAFVWHEGAAAEGKAELRGAEWEWTKMEFHLHLEDGSFVEGQREIGEQRLATRRRIFRNRADWKKGAPYLTIEESLAQIDEVRFRELLDQLESGRWWL